MKNCNVYVLDDKTTVVTKRYKGHLYRGVAKLHPDDEYNKEKGIEIATQRCMHKINKVRMRELSQAIDKNYHIMHALELKTGKLLRIQHDLCVKEYGESYLDF